jgi:hypothetical protein
MDTLEILIGALHPQPQFGRRGLPGDAICWDFNAPDATPGTIGGFRIYNACAETEVYGLAHFAMRAVAGWGRDHAKSVRRLWGHELAVGAIGESLPNDKSRIDLDPDRRDRHGVPLPRISAYLEPGDIVRLRFMATKSPTCRVRKVRRQRRRRQLPRRR